MSDKKQPKLSDERAKKEFLERLIQTYLQAKADGDKTQIKNLENILKRLGYNKFKH